jgi:hypothetical protein
MAFLLFPFLSLFLSSFWSWPNWLAIAPIAFLFVVNFYVSESREFKIGQKPGTSPLSGKKTETGTSPPSGKKKGHGTSPLSGKKKEKEYGDSMTGETVGAVCVDAHGNLAAGTSTGGRTNKPTGRIGDSCIISSGTLAESGTALSATGAWTSWLMRLHDLVVTASL